MAFSPIGVSNRWEGETVSYLQARKFAEAFALPSVRWPPTIAKEGALGRGALGLLRRVGAVHDGDQHQGGAKARQRHGRARKQYMQPVSHVVPGQLQLTYGKGGFKVVTLIEC